MKKRDLDWEDWKECRMRQIKRRLFLLLLLVFCVFLLLYEKSSGKRAAKDVNGSERHFGEPLLEHTEAKNLWGGVEAGETYPEGEIPQSLLELMEKHPETEEFVRNYPKNVGKKREFDLSEEVTKGEIPLFLQWDERWGYENYGGDFLAITGCGPTCLSMVYTGLTGDASYDPYKVAALTEKKGYYVPGAGSSWSMMTDIGELLGLSVHEVVYDESHILEELYAGHPIICIMRAGDFTDSGHFIVLTGIAENGEILVRDPNSRINSEKTWDLGTLMKQMRNLWAFSYT